MPENPHHQRRWTILAILGLAQLMVVLDATIVNIALPSAQTSLHFSTSDRQWIITAYSLAFGGLLLLGGKLSDILGRKWTFIVGLIGFAISSAVGGAAQSFLMLAIARAFQGGFGALLAPAALSLLTTTFTETSERNKAFGIYGAIAGSGASIGLLLGGALTQVLTWRYCMYVNDLLAIVAVAGGLVLLHNVRPAERPRIDVPGTLTVTVGLFAIVFGFNRAEIQSWTAASTLISLAVGVVLLASFAAIEFRSRHPLLPMRVPADRNRGASFLAMLVSAAAMFGVFLFLTYYLQDNRGYSPVHTGIAFLPMTAIIMLTSVTVATVLLSRVSPKILVTVGMLCAAGGMVMFTQIGAGTTYLWPVLPGLLVMGVGLGLIFGTAMNNATVGVRPDDAGVASAVVNACQQVGGAIGTALLSTIAASATSTYAAGHAALARSAGGRAGLENVASIHGYTVAFWVSAGLFIAGAVISGALYRRGIVTTGTAAPAPEPTRAAEGDPSELVMQR
jgi:EmrB/QacA subfamily drug resistance transporter